jgi:hypothetical protein
MDWEPTVHHSTSQVEPMECDVIDDNDMDWAREPSAHQVEPMECDDMDDNEDMDCEPTTYDFTSQAEPMLCDDIDHDSVDCQCMDWEHTDLHRRAGLVYFYGQGY